MSRNITKEEQDLLLKLFTEFSKKVANQLESTMEVINIIETIPEDQLDDFLISIKMNPEEMAKQGREVINKVLKEYYEKRKNE